MSVRSSRFLLPCVTWACLACLATTGSVRAATTLQAAVVDVPGVKLEKLDVAVAPDADGQLQLTLKAARADVPALGWHRVAVDMQARLLRTRADLWSCRGTVGLRGAPGGLLRSRQPFALSIDTGANTLQLDLGSAAAPSVSMALPLDQLSHMQVRLSGMPLSWLQGMLARVWSGRISEGTASGTLAMDFDPDAIQGSALVKLHGASIDAGSVASSKLDFDGRLNFSANAAHGKASVAGALRGGEVLLGPVYAHLPPRKVTLAFDLASQGGSMRLDHLRFADAGVLTLGGGMIFGRDGSIHSLALSRLDAHFPEAYDRYARTWLATLGLRDLKTAGDLAGTLSIDPDGLRALHMQAGKLDMLDAAGRFRVQGLDGGLDWARGATRAATTLAWRGLGLYRIPFGAGVTRWQTRAGSLQLRSPVSIPVLGGQLGIQHLDWRPEAGADNRLDVSATLVGVDMARLSKALGWPVFHGTLAGAMPALHYADGQLVLNGGLSLNVFDGFVDITRLALRHPFGDAPELAADLNLQKLDLGAITRVFDFGRITGRMHGHVSGLRMVDWKPVGFQASLRADEGGRISQRAVNNLTSVGGGGAAGGLQGAVLRLFKNFNYARIGLDCTLKGQTCQMGGLEPEGGGYLIVEGRGLPHLTVIGHQRKVSWPTLVSRLDAAIRNGGPVVQ